jgi:hypothetical protein
MSHEDGRTVHGRQIRFDEICVLNGAPRRRRKRCAAEAGKVEEVDRVRRLKEDCDASQAVATGAPPVQEDEMTIRRAFEDFIDERRAAVFERDVLISTYWGAPTAWLREAQL